MGFDAEFAQSILEYARVLALAFRDHAQTAANAICRAYLRPVTERQGTVGFGCKTPIEELHDRFTLGLVSLAKGAKATTGPVRSADPLDLGHLGFEGLFSDDSRAKSTQQLPEFKVPIHGSFLRRTNYRYGNLD
jgi:hypothetical protein